MAIGVRHQLIGFLARGVEAHRVVNRLTFMKRQIAVAAVDRTARGINKVFCAVVATAFKKMTKAHQIALDVGRWILQ